MKNVVKCISIYVEQASAHRKQELTFSLISGKQMTLVHLMHIFMLVPSHAPDFRSHDLFYVQ